MLRKHRMVTILSNRGAEAPLTHLIYLLENVDYLADLKEPYLEKLKQAKAKSNEKDLPEPH